jgi:hypothetical protein
MGVIERGVQSVFRAANERLRTRMEGLLYHGRRPVICECSNPDCLDVLELTPEEYREVRGAGNFVVASGHSNPAIEYVVERRERFDIVKKYEGDNGV